MAKSYHVFYGDVGIAVASDRKYAVEQAVRWAVEVGIVGEGAGALSRAEFMRQLDVQVMESPEEREGR